MRGFIAGGELIDPVLAVIPPGDGEVGELLGDFEEVAFGAEEEPLIEDELFDEFLGGGVLGLIGVVPAEAESVEVFLLFAAHDKEVGAAAVGDGVLAGDGFAFRSGRAAAVGGWFDFFFV